MPAVRMQAWARFFAALGEDPDPDMVALLQGHALGSALFVDDFPQDMPSTHKTMLLGEARLVVHRQEESGNTLYGS